jgi:hypothetical protein
MVLGALIGHKLCLRTKTPSFALIGKWRSWDFNFLPTCQHKKLFVQPISWLSSYVFSAVRRMSAMAHQAELSSDVLFTDDDPGHTVDNESIYSQPSTTCSSISHEVTFDPRSRQPIYRQYSESIAELNGSRNSSPGQTYNLDDFMPKDSTYQRYRARSNTYSEDTLRQSKWHPKPVDYYSDNYTVPNKPKPMPRHKTWTPPTKDNMGSGASFDDSRHFHSNGRLDVDDGSGHIYEHLDITGPARLPPASGMLSKVSWSVPLELTVLYTKLNANKKNWIWQPFH